MSPNSFYLDDSYVDVETHAEDIVLKQDNGTPVPDRVTISYRDLQQLMREVRKRT